MKKCLNKGKIAKKCSLKTDGMNVFFVSPVAYY